MNTPRVLAGSLVISAFHCLSLSAFAQGSLTPPGAPAPTMKTLDQLDAKLDNRISIPSLPYLIFTPGSYYLRSNLTGVSGQNGIIVAVNDVTIDLNGFSLSGVAGAQAGIQLANGASGVTITNGTVRGWPGGGVISFDSNNGKVAAACHFSRLHLVSNGVGTDAPGLNSGYGAVVSDCRAENNAAVGILAGSATTVERCAVVNSGGPGFNTFFSNGNGGSIFVPTVFRGCIAANNAKVGFAVGYATLENCQAFQNAFSGISASSAVLRGCTALFNGSKGIDVDRGALVESCTATDNSDVGIRASEGSTVVNCVANRNGTHGIDVFDSCRISRNSADGNTKSGIHVADTDNVIEGNKVTNNSGNGIRAENLAGSPAPVSLIYGNMARGNKGTGGNYSIDAGNRVGTIVVPPISGAVSGNSGASGFSSTDPWANVAY